MSRPNDAVRDRFLGRIDEVLKPYIEDQGWDWEYSVIETLGAADAEEPGM
jgi:hypothetical protein